MIRKCKHCGKEFESYHTKRLYCCDKCREAHFNAIARAKERDLRSKEKTKDLEIKTKKKAVLSIIQIVDLARANGMDYGYYVAKYKV